MEFTEQPKQARVHVPDFNQFIVTGNSENIDYKTEVDEWTPSFDDPSIPEHMRWVAQDSDGLWYAYENKPVFREDSWAPGDTHTDYLDMTLSPEHPDGWQNTLTKRPERVSVRGSTSIPTQYIGVTVEEAISLNKIVSAKVKFADGPQQSTQQHYETKSGVDFIQRFIDVHSEERVRGGLLFNIGKYCERYGAKDDMLKEARKIADYANRLVEFEESLLEDKNG